MADLVVKDDLDTLAGELDALATAFGDATRYQDDCKWLWGQHNANLSMGDFAHNWELNRDDMIEDIEKLRDRLKSVSESWTQAERDLTSTLDESK